MNPLAWLTNREEVLTREHFPGLAPYIRRLRTPLGALSLAAVAAGLCGMFLHPQGFVVFFGVLAVMTLGLAWPWLGVCGLEGSLGFDRRRCREGETVKARIDPPQPDVLEHLGSRDQGRVPRPVGRAWRRDRAGWPGVRCLPGARSWRRSSSSLECRGEYPTVPASGGLRVPIRPVGGVAAAEGHRVAAGLAPDFPGRR